MATIELVSPITSATNTYRKGAWVTEVGSASSSVPGERHRHDRARGNRSEPHTEVPAHFLPRAQAALSPLPQKHTCPITMCTLPGEGDSPRQTTG